jgi:hypothetical protein
MEDGLRACRSTARVDGFLLKARLAGADLTVYWPQR